MGKGKLDKVMHDYIANHRLWKWYYPSMLYASQSQALEAMLFQHAVQLTLPIKEPAEAQNDRRREKVETSLVP